MIHYTELTGTPEFLDPLTVNRLTHFSLHGTYLCSIWHCGLPPPLWTLAVLALITSSKEAPWTLLLKPEPKGPSHSGWTHFQLWICCLGLKSQYSLRISLPLTISLQLLRLLPSCWAEWLEADHSGGFPQVFLISYETLRPRKYFKDIFYCTFNKVFKKGSHLSWVHCHTVV